MQIQKFNWIIRRARLYNAGPVYGFGHCNIGTPVECRARLLRGRLIGRPLAYARGTVLARKRTLTMPVRLDQYNYPPPPPPPTPPLGLREATRNLGLYNPYLDAGKSKNSIGVGLMWLAFAVVGLMVAGLMILNVGIGGAIVGAISAIIPAGFYLALFLWLDRYEWGRYRRLSRRASTWPSFCGWIDTIRSRQDG